MKIAIDATIVSRENTGAGFYIINLINGFKEIDNSNNYYIFIDRFLLNYVIEIKEKNFHIIHKKFKNRFFRIFWQLFILPFQLKSMKVDIIHSPHYITPLIKLGFKSIVTIHDMTFFLFPKKHVKMKRLFFRYMIPLFIKKADKIIADSNNTKKDILKFFKIDNKKVVVNYIGFPKYYNNRKDISICKEILKKYGISNDFILFVGMIEPRKNILSLLRAFAEMDKELDLDLVIVGKKGWYYKEIENFLGDLRKMDLKNKVIFTDYVPESEVKYFYQSAFIFVYPSYYEGFGLPPLYAMACGTPVITSNISSLPEVVGDAAIKINPYNLQALISSIKLLYRFSDEREKLIRKGLQQSKEFNLNSITRNVVNLYESLKPSN